MMWFLLLAFPAIVLVLAVVARSGKVTETDTACAVLDLRLDRQADLLRAGAPAQQGWVPQQRKPSRVAPRPMAARGVELLAG
jgi:hypothetical protein